MPWFSPLQVCPCANEVHMLSGEVTEYAAGVRVTIRDGSGYIHIINITMGTIIKGDVQVGSRVNVQGVGTDATYIEVRKIQEYEGAPGSGKRFIKQPKPQKSHKGAMK